MFGACYAFMAILFLVIQIIYNRYYTIKNYIMENFILLVAMAMTVLDIIGKTKAQTNTSVSITIATAIPNTSLLPYNLFFLY
jgi:hypothetical protein